MAIDFDIEQLQRDIARREHELQQAEDQAAAESVQFKETVQQELDALHAMKTKTDEIAEKIAELERALVRLQEAKSR
jgi:hypothetical protein